MGNKKIYDEKRILFVLREPQERIQEISVYLRALRLPEGFTAEVTSNIEGPTAACYNAVQRESNARYKVYIAPGTVILKEDFLIKMVRLFVEQPDIGIIGLLGTEQLPTSGLFWDAPAKVGRALLRDGQRIEGKTVTGVYQDVMAVTDVIATQYDVPWREDLFQGEAFLAASACAEYRRQGYRTVLLASEEEGLLLSDTAQSAEAQEQENFLDTYSQELYPLVSIIIPTYQRPEYFRIALTSAVQQTYRNLDIFITDNSHDTRTKEVYETYFSDDDRIRYEHHPEYHGAAENWRRAIAYDNPQADYVNWLMDDDVFMPEKIATMMDFYFAYPDVMLVTSYRQSIDAQGIVIPDVPMTQPLCEQTTRIRGEGMGRLILTNLCNFVGEPTTALAKKAGMLDGHRLGWTGREGKYCISDYPTWLRLLTQGDVIYIREPLSQFRRHAGQDQYTAPTMAAGLICWGLMIRAAIERHVFLTTEEDRRQALAHYAFSVGQFLSTGLSRPIWKETYLKDLLKVYAGTMEAWTNGYQFSYEIDTSE